MCNADRTAITRVNTLIAKYDQVLKSYKGSAGETADYTYAISDGAHRGFEFQIQGTSLVLATVDHRKILMAELTKKQIQQLNKGCNGASWPMLENIPLAPGIQIQTIQDDSLRCKARIGMHPMGIPLAGSSCGYRTIHLIRNQDVQIESDQTYHLSLN